MSEDYYDMLGVRPDANDTEIRKGYREKAKLMHPDKNPAANAHEKFLGLKKAYDVLRDETQRRSYDYTRKSIFRPSYTMHADPCSSNTFTCYNNDFFCPTTRKTHSRMHKSEEWDRVQKDNADYVYNEWMKRLRRQREEEMRRRYNAFSQDQHSRQTQEDIVNLRKMARIKLFWAADVSYCMTDLKTKLGAKVAFKNHLNDGNSSIMGFKNAQDALNATQVLIKSYENIKFTWLTAKPTFDAKEPIVLDSDSEMEIIDSASDGEVEFVRVNRPTRSEIILSDTEDEEKEEYFVVDYMNDNSENDDEVICEDDLINANVDVDKNGHDLGNEADSENELFYEHYSEPNSYDDEFGFQDLDDFEEDDPITTANVVIDSEDDCPTQPKRYCQSDIREQYQRTFTRRAISISSESEDDLILGGGISACPTKPTIIL